MAQTEILAAAQTAATSTPDVTVAAGSNATISLKTDGTTAVPEQIGLPVYFDNGPGETLVGVLGRRNMAIVVDGPGVYRVKRENISAYGVNVGVSVDQ